MDDSPTLYSPSTASRRIGDDWRVREEPFPPATACQTITDGLLAVDQDPSPSYIAERIDFPDLVALYLKELDATVASRNTYDAYRRDLGQFVAVLGRIKAQAVRPPVIRGAIGDLGEKARETKGKPLTNRSIARKVSCLRSLFRWALQMRILDSDPTVGYRSPRLPKSLPYPLTKPEAKLLVETTRQTGSRALNLRNTAILETLYATGVRATELVMSDLRDLSLREGMLRVMGKGGKERVVPVGRAALRALEAYLADGRPALAAKADSEKALFLNKRGGRLTRRSLQRVVEAIAGEVETLQRVHPHTWRHTFATHLLEGGADLRSVQELLGHASVRSTQIYTKVTSDHMRAEYRYHPRAQAGPKRPGDPEDGPA